MTRPDPATCTAREIYDYVRAHLLRQGVRSAGLDRDGNEACRYRGDNGTSCAVGCLIPDEMYRPEMEYLPVGELVVHDHVPASWSTHVDLLSRLQTIHDLDDPADWSAKLDALARERGWL